jgi:hypothetical protein
MKTIAMYAWYWFKNILLALDQLLNVLLWGDPDETLSRRAGRARDKKLSWGCRLCSILDAIDPRHCQKTLDRVDAVEGSNSVPQLVKKWRAKNGKKATGFKLPKLPQWAMIAIWVLSSSGLTAGGVYYVMHDTVVAKKVYKAKKVRAYR